MDIILHVDKNDRELIENLLNDKILASEEISGAGFDGGSDLVSIMISVTATSLPYLVLLLKNKWKRNKDVIIQVGAMKVKGANPEDINELLKQMIAADKAKKLRK